MNRVIGWESDALDEIELVYEKAEQDNDISKWMEKLELQALSEAAGMLQTMDGSHITPAQFEKLPDATKENAISYLGDAGIDAFDTDIASATMTVTLTPLITSVQACTIFSILNRLEKMDGTINEIWPKWELEFQVPLGGKKGLYQWERMIKLLYPWIGISETSTMQLADALAHPTD